ncbi:MAG: transcriptional regulator GutM [Eubacterium sp.]|nr:transcriptional regulator GutM [Eubacterium sp.]
MLQICLVIIVAFIAQGLLSAIQMKHFTNEFLKMRRKGKVACGRKSGGFRAGAIVMFQIDDHGIVKEAKKLEGITFMARVKPMEGFEGRYIGDLTEADADKTHKNLGKAIADAALSYRKFTAGEIIPEPPTPFEKVGNAIGALAGGRMH